MEHTKTAFAPSRVQILRKRRLGVNLVRAVVVAAIVAAATVGVLSLVDGGRALTADEASRLAFRAAVASGVAILCAVLYAACSRINAWIDMELDRLYRSERRRRREAERAAQHSGIVRTASEAVVLGLESYRGKTQAGS